MTAYLVANKPARSQFRAVRRLHLSPTPGRPTGCTVLHTAESILDLIGPDTGAEGVARFMVSRAEAGSYHDLADSDSTLHLVPYEFEAFQDGTGSNPWALSISWALRAADWPRLTPARRDAFLRQGALAFHRQQAWLRANRYPITPLRRITRSQSDAGMAGFVTHGDRDPGRRSDPGTAFPWARWFELCANPTLTEEDDDMTPAQTKQLDGVEALVGDLHAYMSREGRDIAAGVAALVARGDTTAEQIASAIPADLAQQVVDALADKLKGAA